MTDDAVSLKPHKHRPSQGQAFLYGGILVGVLHYLLTGDGCGAFMYGLLGGVVLTFVAAILQRMLKTTRTRSLILLAVVVGLVVLTFLGRRGSRDLYADVFDAPLPAGAKVVDTDFSGQRDPAQLVVIDVPADVFEPILSKAGFEQKLPAEAGGRRFGPTGLGIGTHFFDEVPTTETIQVWERHGADDDTYDDRIVYDPATGRAWIARFWF